MRKSEKMVLSRTYITKEKLPDLKRDLTGEARTHYIHLITH